MKILTVVGARPNFMKAASIVRAIEKHNEELLHGRGRNDGQADMLEHILVHTGQHYDEAMSGSFFADLGLPKPDVYLGVGSGSHATQTAEIMRTFENVLLRECPDVVLVVGDVNSTLACALVTAKIAFDPVGRRPLLGHVEAGLRSFDRTMPEEINRILTDHAADFLFVTEESGIRNLRHEGIRDEKIHFVGNTMIDTLLAFKDEADRARTLERFGLRGDSREKTVDNSVTPYALLTLHRPANVDSPRQFLEILRGIRELGQTLPVLFPCHPRTQKRIAEFGLEGHFQTDLTNEHCDSPAPTNGIHVVDPLGYLDFLCLMKNARIVVTDSGGIQEETTCLGVPCVTVRENTERPVTVESGTNIISGTQEAGIQTAIRRQMGAPTGKPPKNWDGQASMRIIDVLLRTCNEAASRATSPSAPSDLHNSVSTMYTTPFAATDEVRIATLKLLAYCRHNNWAGYDPYDALNSKVFTALPFLNSRLPRLAMTQVLKRSPVNPRRLMLVPKTHNPKAIALFLSALLKLSTVGIATEYDLPGTMIDHLVNLRSPDVPYWSWGYSFPWQTRTLLVPSGAPNLVCTAFAANALLDAYEQRQDSRCLSMAVSAAEYMVNELYWTDGTDVAGFSYPLPSVRVQVHNANFLAAALLCRVYKHTGDSRFLEPALRAARYSSKHQQPNGSWKYSESPIQQWIDNFHTGFNLCALQSIDRSIGHSEFGPYASHGFAFYRAHFFREDGAPKYFHNQTYPVDIHCVAQSILTLLAFRDLDLGTSSLANLVFSWAMKHMWDDRGFFYYRVLRLFTIRTSYMRWSQAWMLLALSALMCDSAAVEQGPQHQQHGLGESFGQRSTQPDRATTRAS